MVLLLGLSLRHMSASSPAHWFGWLIFTIAATLGVMVSEDLLFFVLSTILGTPYPHALTRLFRGEAGWHPFQISFFGLFKLPAAYVGVPPMCRTATLACVAVRPLSFALASVRFFLLVETRAFGRRTRCAGSESSNPGDTFKSKRSKLALAEGETLRTINPQRPGSRQRGILFLRVTHPCAIRLGIAHTLGKGLLPCGAGTVPTA